MINSAGTAGMGQDCLQQTGACGPWTMRPGGRKCGTEAIFAIPVHVVFLSKLECILILTEKKEKRRKS